jgi:protein gp37
VAQGTSIEYVDHSFSPWWGCSRISPGCARCFAADNARRWGQGDLWRLHGPRRVVSENQWRQPPRWNRVAQQDGRLARVLCGTMCDVFEDHPAVTGARARLFTLIEATPWLAWCLFTKRPGNAPGMVPWGSTWPPNAWLIASTENQEQAGERIPLLLAAPALVKGLSVEPMLSPNDLDAAGAWPVGGGGTDWVIIGGESGRARPMHPQWARDVVGQCAEHSTAAWFKQWGSWGPADWKPEHRAGEDQAAYVRRAAATGATHAYAPDAHLRGHQPVPASQQPWSGERTALADGLVGIRRWGKAKAGHLLDGRAVTQLPAAAYRTPQGAAA